MPASSIRSLKHRVNGESLSPPWPEGLEVAVLGMGCFWGAERLFWQLPGVHVTLVGYAGGQQHEPDYQQVCAGSTGHAEVVKVVFHPQQVSYSSLLKSFWQGHDPTQGMRQGNDTGSQYRSAIYCSDEEQLQAAQDSCEMYQQDLTTAGYGRITTEIALVSRFYSAEEYHQQYLADNPSGYCGIAGTGISYSHLAPVSSGAESVVKQIRTA